MSVKPQYDEQESANEELQSTNEELLSGSEELQSLNEELETSKEELQSTNEEITVMNTELVDRNEQLSNARLYTEGIVNTIRDPLLILNNELRVMKATDGFYKKFRVEEKQTEGQYIYELGNHQWNIPALRNLLEGILPGRKEMADFEVRHNFPGLGDKVMILNARKLNRDQHTELILLAIEDITDRVNISEKQLEAEQLRRLLASEEIGVWRFDSVSQTVSCDKLCRTLLGITTGKIALNKFLKKFDLSAQKLIAAYFLKEKNTELLNLEVHVGEQPIRIKAQPATGDPKSFTITGISRI